MPNRFLIFAILLATLSAAIAQPRPYIGYVYPAGGQQGATVQIRLGGQGLDDVHAVLVTGGGVTGKVTEYYRRLNNQELQLLREQLKTLQTASSAAVANSPMTASDSAAMMSATELGKASPSSGPTGPPPDLIARIEQRTRQYVQTPACASIASLAMVEVRIAADADPGQRELRLVTPKGVSNPLAFHVGQLREFARKPMLTTSKQVLGKEEQALRKRPSEEVEDRITLPCTLNGQIASGEVNRYRFEARRGQRLVITTLARQLVPYIADAVPGWFQPVLVLSDAQGKELAFADDYRFQPDPVMFFEVPEEGEYVLTIADAIYRGREDFVYRITLDEQPFLTSLFPLGRQVGSAATPNMRGWNLQDATLIPPPEEAEPGIHPLAAIRKGFVSNRLPFALGTLPEGLDQEPNNTPADAQVVTLPLTVNGRVDQPDDWDVFRFNGQSNDTIAVEVQARRLASPLDSVIKLTDAAGRLLAFSDDREDLRAGLNTHHADSWFLATLPADGTYYVHLGDTARHGGLEYGYRLRLSAPQPDFALRVVPSSVALRGNGSATLSVYAIRRDGFAGPIKLSLKDPPEGFSAPPVTLPGDKVMTRLTVRSRLEATDKPVDLTVVGTARIEGQDITRAAVPAEDRMQAFLWRHLVPAADLKVLVYDPAAPPAPKRPLPHPAPATVAAKTAVASASAGATPKFNKRQVAGRLRQLKQLYEEGLLTDQFYCEKVAECESVQ